MGRLARYQHHRPSVPAVFLLLEWCYPILEHAVDASASEMIVRCDYGQSGQIRRDVALVQAGA